MDFFDMSKPFERQYIEGGETDGRLEFPDSKIIEEIKPRTSKGRLNEEVNDSDSSSDDTVIFDPEKFDNERLRDLENTTTGSVANLNDLYADKIKKVYETFYRGKNKSVTNLVIHGYRRKILTLIEMNEVTIITGSTGCGKTTQVPQFILDSHVKNNKYCNIIVTQPRRIAAISISKRVCEERNWKLGSLCGFKVGLTCNTSEDTLLTYVTVGVLLQTLITKKCLKSYTHVIVDEIHERTQSMDFLLLVLKRLMLTAPSVKIILMSATVDSMKFARYFQKFYLGKLECAPIIEINNPPIYSVQIYYLDELNDLGEIPSINSENPHISEAAFDVCIKLLKQFDVIEDSTKKKSVLIFLPGIYEIEYLYKKLKNPSICASGSCEYKWDPLPLHSTITSEEQAQIFRSPPLGYRRIILSTNISESSITVPGVKFVIDFCLTKIQYTDHNSNFTSLQLRWASQTNCIQRAGRVGRLMEGRVYRMVPKKFYESLQKESEPEMLTAPMEKIVLQAKILDMGEPKTILRHAIDPPDLSNFEWTILILKEVGALLRCSNGVYTPYDGDLTYLGRLMAILPIDIHITKLIILGHLFSCLEECIIMGACMSIKSIFNNPFKNKMKSYNSKLDWADGSCSDSISFLNVYQVWMNNHKNGFFKRSAGRNEKNWAKRHFIQLRLLKEVNILVEELTRRLKDNFIEEPVGRGKVQWNKFQKALVLKIVIAGAFYPNYFGRGVQRQIDELTAVKMIGGKNPLTTVYFLDYPTDQPIEFYTKVMKQDFIDCSQNLKISSDGSSNKVFVEFRPQNYKSETAEDMPFDGTLPGRIPMAVYRAVKIRQLRKYAQINVLPSDEAHKRAKLLGINIRKHLLLEDSKPSSQKIVSIPVNLPGIDVSEIPITICYVMNPGHFWAYRSDGEDYQKKVFDLLNKSPQYLPYNKSPVLGDIVAAPYEENGEKWFYRARIESVTRKDSRFMIRVYFIDYGNSLILRVDEIKAFSSDMLKALSKYPAQAFECVLSEIQPSLLLNHRGKWVHKAYIMFEKLITDTELVGRVYSVVNGIVALELYKIDNNEDRININEYLVKEGFAEAVSENYLSKTDNELRKSRQLNKNPDNMQLSIEHNEFWLENDVEPPKKEDCTIQLKLRGPYSPLEMKIYPLIRKAISCEVHIANDSVNSVLLDTDPQDPHERLIVASRINESSVNKLILSCVTVMPNIHGLAAIIPFIFAPEVELRVDESKSRYTGILCGLGSDKDGNSLFPEHDFDINFDTEISFHDFRQINCLRLFMSLMLMSDKGETHPTLSMPDTIDFQRKIKTTLLKILNVSRKSQKIVYPSRDFKWNLFHSDLSVNDPLIMACNKKHIYGIHAGIKIKEADGSDTFDLSTNDIEM